jgi:hypothetical protein
LTAIMSMIEWETMSLAMRKTAAASQIARDFAILSNSPIQNCSAFDSRCLIVTPSVKWYRCETAWESMSGLQSRSVTEFVIGSLLGF